jgi:MFS family permease
VIIMGGVAATTALLGLFTSLAALIAVAMVAGMVRGIMTLLQATAVTERWGSTHYGHLSGIFSAPIMISTALGPFIGAALASALNGYAAMFIALAAIAGVAAAVATLSSVRTSPG